MLIRQALVLCMIALPSTGCIHRTITIHSEPSGALVYLNDVEVGRTPTTVPFTFYGEYDVRLVKDGYRTLATARDANAPLYDLPGLDLFAEMAPGQTKVELEWHFELDPVEPTDPATVIDHGRQLRDMLREESQEATAAPND